MVCGKEVYITGEIIATLANQIVLPKFHKNVVLYSPDLPFLLKRWRGSGFKTIKVAMTTNVIGDGFTPLCPPPPRRNIKPRQHYCRSFIIMLPREQVVQFSNQLVVCKVVVGYSVVQIKQTFGLASLPQLSVACRTEKWGEPGNEATFGSWLP